MTRKDIRIMPLLITLALGLVGIAITLWALLAPIGRKH